MFDPRALFFVAESAVFALIRLVIGVTVLHVLLKSEFTGEFTLALRALVELLSA